MFVVGATHPEQFKTIRTSAPNNFLLVPGIGAQEGNLTEISKYGFINSCGLIVNSSRDIIYASNGEDFAEKAKQKAQAIQVEMQKLLGYK